jgi:hypothetical protein
LGQRPNRGHSPLFLKQPSGEAEADPVNYTCTMIGRITGRAPVCF